MSYCVVEFSFLNEAVISFIFSERHVHSLSWRNEMTGLGAVEVSRAPDKHITLPLTLC